MSNNYVPRTIPIDRINKYHHENPLKDFCCYLNKICDYRDLDKRDFIEVFFDPIPIRKLSFNDGEEEVLDG